MEFENEVQVAWSPGARVVVGSPLLPLFGALVVGFTLGAVIVMLAQRHRSAGGRPWQSRAKSAGTPALRVPRENPDVETEPVE
jgi:hypothetical protein